MRTKAGQLRAYAEISAQAGGPLGCRNTVRLLVSNGSAYRQVFEQEPSTEVGSSTSLGPVGWSPDGRWLLVEFGDWFYASDAGGIAVLLYDRQSGRAFLPDLSQILEETRHQACSPRLASLVGFDTRSRVRLLIEDSWEEGAEAPETHCLRGREAWLLDPRNMTMQPVPLR